MLAPAVFPEMTSIGPARTQDLDAGASGGAATAQLATQKSCCHDGDTAGGSEGA